MSDAHEARIDALERELAELGAQLDTILELVQASATAAPAGPALAWAVTATADAWHELAEWVDGLWRVYQLKATLPSCWPRHGGIVEELAGLHRAWKVAAADPTGEPLAYWHDRLLVPTVTRVTASSFYPLANCRSGHEDPTRRPATDRNVISLAAPSHEGEDPAPWPA